MIGDPTKVTFQLWFIPEDGIDQPPTLIKKVVGYEAAAHEARMYFEEDFKEPQDYGVMYTDARAELDRWQFELGPRKWSVALPVHYGTLVIA